MKKMSIRGSSRLAQWALAVAGLGLLSAAAVEADIRDRQVGRQADGSVVVATNQVITPAGRQVEFRGRPVAVALHPDRRTAAVLNGTYRALIVVDLETATVKQEFTAAGSSASFAGLVYAKDGSKLYASQANGRLVIANVAPDGTLALDQLVTNLPNPSGNPYPGGLALGDDGRTLYVVLSRNNTLAAFDLQTRTVVKEIAVGNAPHGVVVRGGKAYVSNQGGRGARPGEFTNDSSGTPIVADPGTGIASTGTVSVVDLARGAVVKTIEVGLHPTALLLDGDRLFVANTNSDTISVIDVVRETLARTVAVEPFPRAPFGSSPNALALRDGRLLVSLGRNNAVALYQVGSQASSQPAFLDLVPTGWYPSSLALDPLSGRLIVANGKGVGSLGPEAKVGPDPATNKTGRYVHSNQGSVSILEWPDPTQFAAYTRQVYANNGWDRLPGRASYEAGTRGADRQAAPVPIPATLGAPSVFKHVFYVVKENRTYDQVFGALPQGNGDATLVQFGRDVTPNHHALAEQFVLFDNLYDSGSNSADGHQWVTQAFVVDYIEKAFGGFTRSYPFNGGDPLAYARSGFVWDNALRHGRSVRAYGEYVSGLLASGPMGTWTDFYDDARLLAAGRDGEVHVQIEARSDIPSLEAALNKTFPPYTMTIPDQYRVEVFLKEFRQYVKNKSLPELVIMCLTNDHTAGTSAGYPTPRAMVADNDLALGRVVDAISHSPYWKDSIIFVVEDDAQNGVDHVDGHRTIGFVISPYTRRGVVDSRYYTQIDWVRAIEQILGLPPMNQMDTAVDPRALAHLFTDEPDLTPYEAVPNTIPLDELNPSVASLSGLQKQWALQSERLDLSRPDAADERMLNRAIWYAIKGFKTRYPGDPRVLSPEEVHARTRDGATSAADADGDSR